MAREELQEKENVFQVYFTGCAGDVLVGKLPHREHPSSQGPMLAGFLARKSRGPRFV
jgi:hypothetical protein